MPSKTLHTSLERHPILCQETHPTLSQERHPTLFLYKLDSYLEDKQPNCSYNNPTEVSQCDSDQQSADQIWVKDLYHLNQQGIQFQVVALPHERAPQTSRESSFRRLHCHMNVLHRPAGNPVSVGCTATWTRSTDLWTRLPSPPSGTIITSW